MKIFFYSLLLSLLVSNAKATTYYFSNSGVTTNTGTSTGSPWPASKFTTAFVRGNTVLFHRGETFYIKIPSLSNKRNYSNRNRFLRLGRCFTCSYGLLHNSFYCVGFGWYKYLESEHYYFYQRFRFYPFLSELRIYKDSRFYLRRKKV
jgi:hypothetical protein